MKKGQLVYYYANSKKDTALLGIYLGKTDTLNIVKTIDSEVRYLFEDSEVHSIVEIQGLDENVDRVICVGDVATVELYKFIIEHECIIYVAFKGNDNSWNYVKKKEEKKYSITETHTKQKVWDTMQYMIQQVDFTNRKK